jgi:hypothetical protein
MSRVTDDMVTGFLVWARNYGEIESYRQVADSGRKWRIRLPMGEPPVTASGRHAWTEDRIVPTEFVLTSREALAFGYGVALAGGRTELRADFAKREWGWT